MCRLFKISVVGSRLLQGGRTLGPTVWMRGRELEVDQENEKKTEVFTAGEKKKKLPVGYTVPAFFSFSFSLQS